MNSSCRLLHMTALAIGAAVAGCDRNLEDELVDAAGDEFVLAESVNEDPPADVFLPETDSTQELQSGESSNDFDAEGSEQDSLPVRKMGVRRFEYARKIYSVPWYHVRADHNEVESDSVWSRIKAVDGSRSTYLGRYGDMEVIDLSFPGHEHAWTTALDLTETNYRKEHVSPGPGPVYIRAWYFDDPLLEGSGRFKRGDYHYVVCLDHQPKKTFENSAGEAGCDLSSELEHVIGIIEVEHTFEWQSLPDWKMFSLTERTIQRFDAKDGGCDYSIAKNDAGEFTIRSEHGTSVASRAIVDRLLYTLRSCQWQERDSPREVRNPSYQSQLVLQNGRKAILTYIPESWVMTVDGTQYETRMPRLLYRVHHLARKLVEVQ